MSRYIISDHHFGHSNIIEYCDRPFRSVGEMNDSLLEYHYETVDNDDLLIHLGDVAMDMQDGKETIAYFERLGADLLLQGNHDVGLDHSAAPFPVLNSCVLEQDGFKFYCTHRPEDVPDEWNDWVIHGHHHNNHPEEYPFVAYDEKRINVSCELLNYRPVSLESLSNLLEHCPPSSRLRDVATARAHVESTI